MVWGKEINGAVGDQENRQGVDLRHKISVWQPLATIFDLLFPGFLGQVFGDVAVQIRLQLEALAADETHEDLTRMDTKQMFPTTTATTH